MKANCEFGVALLATVVLISGCAQDGTMTTGSLNVAPDPACVTLASQIKKLEDQGVPEKVAKAEKKKQKLTSSDLAKVAQLKKANADFQAKCPNMPPKPNVAAAPSNADKKAAAAAKQKLAAKGPPPIPVHKPVTTSLGATNASAQAEDKPAAAQPTLQTGTATIAPLAPGNPAAAQSSIETGTVSVAPPAPNAPNDVQQSPQAEASADAPPAQDKPEAAQLSPNTDVPAIMPPVQ